MADLWEEAQTEVSNSINYRQTLAQFFDRSAHRNFLPVNQATSNLSPHQQNHVLCFSD